VWFKKLILSIVSAAVTWVQRFLKKKQVWADFEPHLWKLGDPQ